ncbi:MAG: glycosyltransferase family 2 protein [bacterium]
MVLLICPVFNEENKILAFFKSVINYVYDKVNLLVLEDFSQDSTRQICLHLYNNLSSYFRKRIFFIFNERNMGYGDNLLNGFRYALEKGYDKIITIDCDFQHLPSYIPVFISLSRKYHFVTGTRYSMNSLSVSKVNFFRYMINLKMIELLKFFYGVKVSDFFCGFRVYSYKLLEYIYLSVMSYKKQANVIFSYDFPVYLWVDILNFTLNIFELPIPFIFFEERNFKGKHASLFWDHYQRVQIYVEKFMEYYNLKKK